MAYKVARQELVNVDAMVVVESLYQDQTVLALVAVGHAVLSLMALMAVGLVEAYCGQALASVQGFSFCEMAVGLTLAAVESLGLLAAVEALAFLAAAEGLAVLALLQPLSPQQLEIVSVLSPPMLSPQQLEIESLLSRAKSQTKQMAIASLSQPLSPSPLQIAALRFPRLKKNPSLLSPCMRLP